MRTRNSNRPERDAVELNEIPPSNNSNARTSISTTRSRRQNIRASDGNTSDELPTNISPGRRQRMRGISKQKEQRMPLIIKALKGWHDEPSKLFMIETWKDLIQKALKGTNDERKFRGEDRCTSLATAIIEQIASEEYAEKISQIISSTRSTSRVRNTGEDRSTEFLILCSDFQTNQSNKTWKRAVGGSSSGSGSGDCEDESSTTEGPDDEDIRTVKIELKSEDRQSVVKVLEYEVEGEKENVAQTKRQTRGLSKAQQLPLGIKSSQPLEAVIRNNSSPLPQSNKTAAAKQYNNSSSVPHLINGSAASIVFKNEFAAESSRCSVDEPSEIKRSSPASFILGPDDEVIENETPPPTPLNGLDAEIIPRKRTRFNSRDLDKMPLISNRRIRSDSIKLYGDSSDDLPRGSRNAYSNGFDFDALGSSTNSRDYCNDELPDLLEAPDTGRYNDKENAPKSEQEIIRDYPKPPNGPDLRPYMFDEMEEALSRPRKDKIVTSFGLTLRQEQLAVYNKAEWLEDANIDFYLEMIKDRNNKRDGNYPKVYIFQSYFYKLLEKRGYESVQGATGKDNLFEYDLVLIPIHSDHHWVLVVVDFRQKSMMCYDSMDHDNEKHLRVIAEFLKRHWKEVEKDTINSNREIANPLFTPFLDGEDEFGYLGEDWQIRNLGAEDIPQQKNGRDCGIFCLQFAEYLSRRQNFDFEQRHTAYFRKRMLYETLKKTLLIS